MGEEELLSIISPWKVVICCSEMFQLKIEIMCYYFSSQPRLISVLFIYILRTYDVFPSCIENNFINLKITFYAYCIIDEYLHKSWESPSRKHEYLTTVDGCLQLKSLIHRAVSLIRLISVAWKKSILPALTTRWPHLHRIWEN